MNNRRRVKLEKIERAKQEQAAAPIPGRGHDL
jgi:ribosome modulation factor